MGVVIIPRVARVSFKLVTRQACRISQRVLASFKIETATPFLNSL